MNWLSQQFTRLFGASSGNQASRRAAEHWGKWQQTRNASRNRFVDWGDHPTILQLIYREAFGSEAMTVFDYLKAEYPAFRQARALSLCSGDGAFEKLLVANEVFGAVVGMDISPSRVEAANNSRGDFSDRLEYTLADVNHGDFGVKTYDVVFAKAALHHIEQLEALLRGIKRCLRQGGHLVTIDFFGPSRFQWTDAQLAAVNGFLAEEVPADLRRKPDGTLHEQLQRPTTQQMLDIDPSEAVRSGELLTWITGNFTVERNFPVGGTLLQLIFDGTIVNNFDPENHRHNDIIRRAFALEQGMMQRGEIGCDYRFIIAR